MTVLYRICVNLLVAIGLLSIQSLSYAQSVLVCQTLSDRVEQYDTFGNFELIFASPIDNAQGITLGPDGNVYVSSHGGMNVQRFDGTTGDFIDVFASGGGLNSPAGLIFGPDGNLYVSSYSSHEVLRYDGSTGVFIDVFASGSGLNLPNDVVFGLDGNLYVASRGSAEVLRYDGTTGEFIGVFATGSGLFGPAGVVFGCDGFLYVTSQLPGTAGVFRFDGTTGDFVDVFATTQNAFKPEGLAFDADGNLWVADFGVDRIYKFDGATGAELVNVATLGFKPNDVLPLPGVEIIAYLDIKPGSCPNSFNRNSKGMLPVGLLGSDVFDVLDVNISSITISRADGVGGNAAPNEGPPGPHTKVADVGTPFLGELCDCHELKGDGIDDLAIKFRMQDVVSALELNSLPPGSLVELVVSGITIDCIPFTSSDCIRIVPHGKPPNGDISANALHGNADGG